MAPRISLFVVAALLLGAHFLRAGNWPAMALCLAAPLLFFYRNLFFILLSPAFILHTLAMRVAQPFALMPPPLL